MLPRAVRLAAEEIEFLAKHDRLVARSREIIDMTDRRLTDLLAQILTNGGRLSQNKRKQKLSELRNEEIAAIETAYEQTFRLGS